MVVWPEAHIHMTASRMVLALLCSPGLHLVKVTCVVLLETPELMFKMSQI